MSRQRIVGILLFDEVEVLDFSGPYEVFSLASYTNSSMKPFVVKTISETGQTINARNGLRVEPDYDFSTAPNLDILMDEGQPLIGWTLID